LLPESPRRRRRFSCAGCLFVLAALALIGFLAGREMNARLRTIPAEVLAPPPPATPAEARVQKQAQATAEQALRDATQVLARARRQETAAAAAATNVLPAAPPAAVAGRAAPALAPIADAPYQVVFREKDLNTLLRTHAGAKKALKRWGVDAAVVHLKPGRLRVGALVHLPPLPGLRRDAQGGDGKEDAPLYVEAEGGVTVDDMGRLTFHPEAVRVGAVNAPAAVAREVEKRLSDVLARATNRQATSRLPGRLKNVRLEEGRIVLDGIVPARAPNAPPRPE